MSPHLDDAVLSLGATIAKIVRDGAKVEVLTVYGSEPKSVAPAGPWDRKSGFKTEGESASTRREEDRRACRALGAEPRWLNFGSEPYERHASEHEILSAVKAATRGADVVLLPGYPLAHGDHAELSQLLLRTELSCRAVGLYIEQPYLYYQRKTSAGLSVAPVLRPLIGDSLVWTQTPTDSTLRRKKMRAVREYASQLPQLGLGFIGLRRMLWHESGRGGEAVAWLCATRTAAMAAATA